MSAFDVFIWFLFLVFELLIPAEIRREAPKMDWMFDCLETLFNEHYAPPNRMELEFFGGCSTSGSGEGLNLRRMIVLLMRICRECLSFLTKSAGCVFQMP